MAAFQDNLLRIKLDIRLRKKGDLGGLNVSWLLVTDGRSEYF